ncbi:MAG: hypothetical protein LJE68_17195 [Rhodobacter sp.]|nr:hypothetical protein [Rhodobacter sp.]
MGLTRALTLWLVLLAGPVWATPPRVTYSDDRLVAATQTHFYVLRELVDNRGSHWSELRDQYLVEISLDSGKASNHWLLRSMQIDRLLTNVFLSPGTVTEHAGGTHDMMALLAAQGAAPMRLGYSAAQQFTVDGDGLRNADGAVVADMARIARTAKAQLLPLAIRYPPLASTPEPGGADVLEYYVMGDPADWLCVVLPGSQTLYRESGEMQLLPMQCEDDATLGRWSFHMVLEQ